MTHRNTYFFKLKIGLDIREFCKEAESRFKTDFYPFVNIFIQFSFFF
jgi:hypothetical protein